MIWKFGESGSNCTRCGKRLEGELCASYATIRICNDCFIEIGPDCPIAWTLSNELGNSFLSEARAVEVAAIIIKELNEYGIVLGRKEAICPSCFGAGKVGADIRTAIKCTTCDGKGTFVCRACGGSGHSTTGQKCPSCRR